MEESRDLSSLVLVVDDDAPIRNLVRHVVKRLGLDCVEARDGAEAIAMLAGGEPKLMLLDLMMPKMNGWQVLEYMQQGDKIDRVPVIVLTAVGAQRTETLPSLGARAVLSKPFDIHDLTNTITKILEPRPDHAA